MKNKQVDKIYYVCSFGGCVWKYINSRLKLDLTVVDMLGNIVISKLQTNVLDVSKLTPGVYNVTIYHDKIKTNKKIIKK